MGQLANFDMLDRRLIEAMNAVRQSTSQTYCNIIGSDSTMIVAVDHGNQLNISDKVVVQNPDVTSSALLGAAAQGIAVNLC